MMSLTPALKPKFEAALNRANDAGLVVTEVSVNFDGASYRVASPTGVHFVYIAKENGQATFHCDCRGHEGNKICRCGAAALHEFKTWLIKASNELAGMLDALMGVTGGKPEVNLVSPTALMFTAEEAIGEEMTSAVIDLRYERQQLYGYAPID